MTTKKKVLTGIAGVLLVAATAGYGAAAYYYSSHFYSHTEINGTDYGEMTVAQVKKKIADQIPSYQITIEERNGQEETLTGEQLKLTYQDDGEIDGRPAALGVGDSCVYRCSCTVREHGGG